MKPVRPAARWRRLLLLGVLVLAVHVWLLQAAPPRMAPPRAVPVQFATRSVVPPAPPPTDNSAASVPAAAEATPPAPRVRRAPVAPAPAPPATAAAAAPLPSPPAAPPAPNLASTDSSLPALPLPPTPAVPVPARLHYEVQAQARGNMVSGRAQLDWRHDGKQYEARLEMSHPAMPLRIQRSTGRITEHGLAPDYFSDRGRGEQATHFDREKGRVVFSNNRPQAAITVGLQDGLSVLVQLAMLIGPQPERFPPGTQVTIPTASTREAEDWSFVVEGEEDLDLPGGTVRALKIVRGPRREYHQQFELWLAPRMDYAPVRLRLTNPDGRWVDHRWSSTDRS